MRPVCSRSWSPDSWWAAGRWARATRPGFRRATYGTRSTCCWRRSSSPTSAYIGLHLRFVLGDLQEAHESLMGVVVGSAIVLAIVMLIRPVSVLAMFGRRKLSRHVENRFSVPVPETGGRGALGTKRRARPTARWRSLIDRRSLTWQENVAVSWTGMRGVVSVGTLLIQGWTLPVLIRRLRLSEDDAVNEREETRKAERVVYEAADETLAEFRSNPPEGLDPRILTEIRNTIARHSQDADEMPDPEAHTLRSEVFAALYPRRPRRPARRAHHRAR